MTIVFKEAKEKNDDLELVLTIHRDEISKQLVGTSGIFPINLKQMDQESYCFMPRHIVDNKSAQSIVLGSMYPQIISYFQMKNNDGKILTYQRKGKEEGLLGKWSIGVGGHINIDDYVSLNNVQATSAPIPFYDLIKYGCQREIEEELGLSLKHTNEQGTEVDSFEWSSFDGVINQIISTFADVTSTVHLGMISTLSIDTEKHQIYLAKNEFLNPQWLSVEELKQSDLVFEEWSRLVIESL